MTMIMTTIAAETMITADGMWNPIEFCIPYLSCDPGKVSKLTFQISDLKFESSA